MKAGSSHGGNVYAAARETGRPVHRLVDFSASINPLGPSPRAIRAIASALPQILHYPDPDCLALRGALAKRLGLTPESLMIGNGSSEIIHLLPAALSIRHALIVGPTFSEYARAMAAAGGRISLVNATREDRYRPPLTRVRSMILTGRPHIDAVFLCNPNSPTGRSLAVELLMELLQAASYQGLWVVIDETFVDYCEDLSVISQVGRNFRLIILRSFTKFYALPGLRIGYAAGTPEVILRIRKRQPPWSVNSLAQVAALAGLEDRGHARKSLAFMQEERRRLITGLKSLPGVVVFPSAANFLLVELPRNLTAARCIDALRRHGMLVRECLLKDGFNSRTIRMAVRTPAQNQRLLTALRRLLKDSM
ncbi:MAG: threonine-phosphate decarboxylase [Nitrospiraceae bacterium]|nr:threonine-phosphate decarboxylase [Nitrospiraceae bacterium]